MSEERPKYPPMTAKEIEPDFPKRHDYAMSSEQLGLPPELSGAKKATTRPESDPPTTPGLPTSPEARKAVPLYRGLMKYFPDALVAVAHCSWIGNEQHNPGTELHWDRSKSGDEYDALMRHLLEAGTVDSDNIRHSTKVAWRALAALQKEIEAGHLDTLV